MLCQKRISKPSRAQRVSEAAESEQPGKPAADSPCRPVSTQPRPKGALMVHTMRFQPAEPIHELMPGLAGA